MTIEKFEVHNRYTNAIQFTAEIEVTPGMTMRVKLGLAVKWGKANSTDLIDADLSGADLSGADLSSVDMSGANLRGADLSGADLSGADLIDADLSSADMSGADLRGARLIDANLSNADMSGTGLIDANLNGADLIDADLRGSDLSGANLIDADMRRADLRGAHLRGANLLGTNLSGPDLRSFKADLFMTLLHAKSEVPYLIAALKEGRVDGSQYEGECACLVGTLANGSGKKYSEMFTDWSSHNPAEQWFLMIRKGDKAGDNSGGGFAARMALDWAEEFHALMGTIS